MFAGLVDGRIFYSSSGLHASVMADGDDKSRYSRLVVSRILAV